MSVVTLGDNDGDKQLETLEGEVLSSNGKVVTTTCATRPGCSGGALLDADSLEVIGLHTWGIPADVKAVDMAWSKDQDDLEDKLAGASILHEAGWADVAVGDFVRGHRRLIEYVDTLKVLLLIYSTTPTKSGFDLGYDDPFAAGLTHRQAFEALKGSQILRPVADLNEKLGRTSGTNIGVNNMEVVKTYAKAIQAIRAAYAEESKRILRNTPPYFRIMLENRGLIKLGAECHQNLATAQKWFNSKASVGGKMPVGRWIPLPPLGEF
jgi:hypothetical protein